MIRTYQGRFLDDGRFVPDGIQVKMPTRQRVIVNILDEAAEDIDLQYQNVERAALLKQIFSEMDAVEDEPITEEDLINFENNRVRFTKEFRE